MKTFQHFVDAELSELKFENYQQFLHYNGAHNGTLMALMTRAADKYADQRVDAIIKDREKQ